MAVEPEFAELYERQPFESVPTFRVVGQHPRETDKESHAWQMIGGRQIQRCVNDLVRMASSTSTNPILLHGPTGVGKELAARVIYQQRVRSFLPTLIHPDPHRALPVVVGTRFFALNCTAIPETLAESELFGCCQGTATGVTASPGAILSAGEGVVVLDELSFLDLTRQARLLRALQPPFRVTPVGYLGAIPVSALIVASMSEEPNAMMEQKRLLPELYGRFQSGVVRIPSLAERPGDIPALLARVAGGKIELDETVLRCLLADDHPFNVRGLSAIVSSARRRAEREGVPVEWLRIQIEDLGRRDEFEELGELARRSHESPAEPLRIRFECPVPAPIVEESFDTAALVMSSIASTAPHPSAPLTLRTPASLRGGRARPEQPSRKPPQENAQEDPLGAGALSLADATDAGDRWCTMIKQLQPMLDPVERNRILQMMGGLALARLPDLAREIRGSSHARRPLAMWLLDRLKLDQSESADHRQPTFQSVAISLGITPQSLSNHLPKVSKAKKGSARE